MECPKNGSLFKLMARFFLINSLIFSATAKAVSSEDFQCEGETLTKAWQLLENKKIFFAHQSVGDNIVNGLELLAEKCNKQFTPLETRDANKVNDSIFVHAKVGKNKQPETKLADFELLMEQGMGEKVDIALLKFCYIDIQHDTNIDELFIKYRDTLASLSKRYPDTKYLAVSAPLTTIQTGLKMWIKKALGHPSRAIENKKRQEFNERLRLTYSADNRLFDIAAIESTLPDGSREKYQLDGQEYYSLYKGYTDDGSHLNEVGQLHAAQALLDMLGKM